MEKEMETTIVYFVFYGICFFWSALEVCLGVNWLRDTRKRKLLAKS